MLNPEDREIALKKMDVIVDDFYRQAIVVNNNPFIEFAGIMQAYIKTCRRAHEAGIDFSECNRHSDNPLPMEGFEIDYLNKKLNCILTAGSLPLMTNCYLTDRRDQIVFGGTPTLMQPLHGEALPKPETGRHRFVIASDGVYVEAVNPVLEVRLPVAKFVIKLPYGQIGRVGVRLAHGQIPKRILQDVCEKTFLCAEYEWAGLVVWDKIRCEYALYEPYTISFSARHISYRNVLPDEYELVMDLHSHGNIPAFFSKTDDKSDMGGFYIAGVVGNCDSGEPTFATRIVVNGHFFECSDFRKFFSSNG